MPTFTLTVLEQIGACTTSELRLLGQRHLTATTIEEGKQWLSQMIAEGRLESDRFYRFESSAATAAMRRELLLNVSFYLFADRRLCPLRIWSRKDQAEFHKSDPDWTVDFEGVPGWSLIASIEPRWSCNQTVPAERPWMGRSHRDWQKRNCYVVASPTCTIGTRAA